MGAAYGRDEPPPELHTAWECARWECLPESGGYYDQDYVLMLRMTALSNVYSLMQKWQTLSGKAIHLLSDNDRRALRWLRDQGIIFQ